VLLPGLPPGGYGVDAETTDGATASTAVDVLVRPLERLRYGFASDFAPGRNPAGLALHARRMHLNAVQLYDWMYRHADLVAPQDAYDDALGRRLSLGSVRGVVEALRGVGSQSLAYAAVYAVGKRERSAWADAALLRPSGRQWQLGDDFLWLVDPAHPRWVEHLGAELERALGATGAAGFHLDQYGWPKAALTLDGREVHLERAFPELLSALRARLPEASLMFNNVNDFPSWSTASSPLDASYVEVWPPHSDLSHIAALATQTRAWAPQRPAVLAAYPSVMASAPPSTARPALELLLATAFSHGATVLATGESGAVLTDPYYPRHHVAAAATLELLRRYHDLLVRLGDLLVTPSTEITRTHAGGINEEIAVTAPGVAVATDALPGALWLRALDTAHGRVIHIVNLAGQTEAGWDAPKAEIPVVAGAELRLRRELAGEPVVVAFTPDEPRPQRLAVASEGEFATATLPPLGAWTVLLVQ